MSLPFSRMLVSFFVNSLMGMLWDLFRSKFLIDAISQKEKISTYVEILSDDMRGPRDRHHGSAKNVENDNG